MVKKLNFCSDFEHKVWSRFEVEAQARFDAGVWSVFFLLMFCKGNVESKLNLGRDCEARFGQDFEL